MVNKNEIQRTCPFCGNIYTANKSRLKHGRQTTCSRKCSYKLRAKGLENSVSLSCAVCEKTFTRCASQVKSKHKHVFCSPECQYKGRSLGLTQRIVERPYVYTEDSKEALREGGRKSILKRKANGGYSHTEATKRKMSAIMSEKIANGDISRVSKIEYAVKEQLEILNINHIHQYAMRNNKGQYFCCVDFFLPDYNAVIEVNGTFWHADNRIYDVDNLTPSQKRTVEKYNKKKAKLLEMGMQFIEIWEQEIREDVAHAVKVAVSNFSP